MDRISFLQLLAAVAGAPNPGPSPSGWPGCVTNPALPYGQRLDLTLPTLDGADFHLLAYRGQAVLLNLFATWCDPCNEEQPLIVDFATRYKSRGLATIGINVKEPDNTVRAYREKFGITFPIAMDRQGTFTKQLKDGASDFSMVLPTSLLVTPKGDLYCYRNGEFGKRGLEYLLHKLLAEVPPTVTPPSSA
jgi:thiol-disulfide isomerase/thioredoxin